jgi:hypothetical protein
MENKEFSSLFPEFRYEVPVVVGRVTISRYGHQRIFGCKKGLICPNINEIGLAH